MRKVFIYVTVICFFVVAAQAQMKMKTITGYFCDSSTGNRAGAFAFRVGSKVMLFDMNFYQQKRSSNAKMIRFNANKLNVGDEFIIKYEDGDGHGWIRAITGTGKRKKIDACPNYLEHF